MKSQTLGNELTVAGINLDRVRSIVRSIRNGIFEGEYDEQDAKYKNADADNLLRLLENCVIVAQDNLNKLETKDNA